MIDSEYITPNFKKAEFACSCCGQDNISYELVKKLQELRMEYGAPMAVTSGVRCKKFNENLKGSAKFSSHLSGKAADIAIDNSKSRYRLVNTALKMGWKRIGVARQFIHLDIDETKGQEVIWAY